MASLWLSKYEQMCHSLSRDEIELVEDRFAECDDGCYAINNDMMAEIEGDISNEEKEKLSSMLSVLKETLEKEGGYLAVRIY